MASKKNLKKDINFLIDEVIGTCMIRQTLRDEKVQGEMDNLIKEMLEYREEMLNKVNNPEIENGDGKALKKYYKSLYGELLEKVNEVFNKLDVDME